MTKWQADLYSFGTDRWFTKFTLSQAKILPAMCHLIQGTWDILLSGIYFHVSSDLGILKCADLSIAVINTLCPGNPSIWLNCTFYDHSNCPNYLRHIPRSWDNSTAWPRQQQQNIGPGGRSSPTKQQHTTATTVVRELLLKAAVVSELANNRDRWQEILNCLIDFLT